MGVSLFGKGKKSFDGRMNYVGSNVEVNMQLMFHRKISLQAVKSYSEQKTPNR